MTGKRKDTELREAHGSDEPVAPSGSAASSPSPAAGPRHLGLVFAAGPIVVFVLAQVVFELAGADLARPATPGPRAAGASAVVAVPGEASARLLWAASVLIFYVAALAALLGSFTVLRSHVTRRLLSRYVGVGLVLTGATLLHLVVSGQTRNAFSAIYFFTFERLAACHCLEAERLSTYAAMEIAVNVLAAIAPMVVLLATCAVLEPTGSEGADALQEIQHRMRRLKRLLNLASTLLVAGMLNMILWLRWPSTLTAQSTAASPVPDVADAVTFFWGTVFTLVTVALYVPASMEFNRRAEAVLRRHPQAKGSARDTAEWLERHGLSLTPSQQLPQVLAMLAPMLAGSVGSGIAGMPGALLGG